jgi:proline dehydrogenase
MATVQANLRRNPHDVARLAAAGVPVRLVKGAYVEPAGLANPWGEATDVAFLRLAHQLREAGAAFSLATHDRCSERRYCWRSAPPPVEMLLGVRPQDARDLVHRAIEVRCYVPYGPDWFRYWMRRLAESQGAR